MIPCFLRSNSNLRFGSFSQMLTCSVLEEICYMYGATTCLAKNRHCINIYCQTSINLNFPNYLSHSSLDIIHTCNIAVNRCRSLCRSYASFTFGAGRGTGSGFLELNILWCILLFLIPFPYEQASCILCCLKGRLLHVADIGRFVLSMHCFSNHIRMMFLAKIRMKWLQYQFNTSSRIPS